MGRFLFAISCFTGALAVQAEPSICTVVDPQFPSKVLLRVGSVRDTVVADLDGDGETEFAYLEAPNVDSGATLEAYRLHFPGDGTIARVHLFTAPAPSPSSIAQIDSGDFDADGRIDLAIVWRVIDLRNVTVDLFLNRGDHFAPPLRQMVTTEFFPTTWLGDFNGDGRTDLVTNQPPGCYPNRNGFVLYTFDLAGGLVPISSSCGSALDGAYRADVNGDQIDDLIGVTRHGQILMRLGDTASPLGDERPYAIATTARITVMAGLADQPDTIVRHDLATFPAQIEALRYSAEAGIGLPIWDRVVPSGVVAEFAWSSDWDRDGRADLLFRFDGSYDYYGFQLLLGRDDAAPVDGPTALPFAELVFIRDVDGDDRLDAVILQRATGFASIHGRQDGTLDEGTTYTPIVGGADLSFATGFPADFDNDGADDLATYRAVFYGYEVNVRRGDGAGGFGLRQNLPHPYLCDSARSIDLDRDGAPDLITELSYAGRAVAIAWNDGHGQFSRWREYGAAGGSARIAVGDLDGDGDQDFLISGRVESDSGREWDITPFWLQERQLAPGRSFRVSAHVEAAAIVDIDGDHLGDIVYDAWQAPRGSELRWRRQEAPGLFGSEQLLFSFSTPARIAGIESADLDEDGTAEVVVELGDFNSFLTASRSIVLRVDHENRGTLIWEQQDNKVLRRFRLSDLDVDGHLDLVSRIGELRWYRGDGTGGFANAPTVWLANPFSEQLGEYSRPGFADLLSWQRHLGVRYWVLTPQQGEPRREDLATPTIQVKVRALDSDRYLVGAAAFDDCRTATISARRVDLIPLPPDVAVSFVVDSSSTAATISVFEEPSSRRCRAVVSAADRVAALALWERIGKAGGAAIEQNQTLVIRSTGQYGPGAPPNGVGTRGYRLVQQLRFAGEALAAVDVQHPTLVPTATFVAVDESGKTSARTVSLTGPADKIGALE